jgi:hemoglobin
MGDRLYERLRGYDAIAAVAGDLMPRLMHDPQLGRFGRIAGMMGWREMKRTHTGMRIGNRDWQLFLGHLTPTLEQFNVPARERHEVFAFVESTKADIVEMG